MSRKARTSLIVAGATPFRKTGSAMVLLAVLLVTIGAVVVSARADDAADDLRVDRKEVFEFTKKPAITRAGQRVTVRFAAKDYCDVAVAIEDADGQIVRHLAYGVLGANAPVPFEIDSLEQEIVWDGEDDAGRPVSDTSGLSVRVSLGLKARLERNLFWHPKKRIGTLFNPFIVAQPEGVYVYDGDGADTVRLFGHDGTYIRTVYPWPADDIEKVKGVKWHTFADGQKGPVRKPGIDGDRARQSFLFGGTKPCRGMGYSFTSTIALAVHDGSMALVSGPGYIQPRNLRGGYGNVVRRLNRLGVAEAVGAHQLDGPLTDLPYGPRSLAFSPDKKWLYITGLLGRLTTPAGRGKPPAHPRRHAVYRMEFDGDEPAKVWLGEEAECGKDDRHFNVPAYVCVDAAGRVYVADHINDRVQIFSAAGQLLKSLPAEGPAVLQIHHKTGELYVFAFQVMTHDWQGVPGSEPRIVPALLSVFDPFKSDEPKLQVPLPLEGNGESGLGTTFQPWSDDMMFRAVLDSWTDPPTLWMCTHHIGGQPSVGWYERQISRYRLEGDRLVLLEDFNDEVKETIKEWEWRKGAKRHMRVDHRTGMLYVEGSGGHRKGPMQFSALNRIDPATGEVTLVPLPMSAVDFGFDDDGHLYLRGSAVVGRFDLETIKEVPFKNGIPAMGASMYGGQRTELTGGVRLVRCAHGGASGGHYWQSGFGVNSRGDFVVGWAVLGDADRAKAYEGGKKPSLPPGIKDGGVARTLFDRGGKMIVPEATAFRDRGFGAFLDNRGDVYIVFSGRRKYDDGRVTQSSSGVLAKYSVGKGELPDTKWRMQGREDYYVTGADWIYPYVSFVTQGCPCFASGSGCLAVDHFGRSFVGEHFRGQVAVLDTAGNLVMHVGRYGNVDDGVPMVPDPEGLRAEPPRSIGGDEVALAYGQHLASHTDQRLFIFDGVHDCIRSVKLDYHVSERVPF